MNTLFSNRFPDTTNRGVTNRTLWLIKSHQSANLVPVLLQAAQLVLVLRCKITNNVV